MVIFTGVCSDGKGTWGGFLGVLDNIPFLDAGVGHTGVFIDDNLLSCMCNDLCAFLYYVIFQ